MGKGTHPSILETFEFRLQTEVKMRLSEPRWCPSWKMTDKCVLRLKAWVSAAGGASRRGSKEPGTSAALFSLCNSASWDLKILKTTSSFSRSHALTLLSHAHSSRLWVTSGALSPAVSPASPEAEQRSPTGMDYKTPPGLKHSFNL